MSFVEVNMVDEEVRTVDYMGGTVELPVHHNWVAVQSTNGKSVLLSFLDKPIFGALGWESKGDYRVLGEVENLSMEQASRTLRKVGDMSLEDCILSNAEELSHKIAAVIASDQSDEEKILSLFDAKKGLFAEFHAYQDDLLVRKAEKVKHETEQRNNANRLAKLEYQRKQAEVAYRAEYERQNPPPQQSVDADACVGQCAEGPAQHEPKPRIRLVALI